MSTQDLTQQRVEEEGSFRAVPVEWTFEQAESGAGCIAMKLAITSKWHGKEEGWSPEWPAGYFTENRSWIIKKDGTLNARAVESLAKAGVWNGDFDALAGEPPRTIVIADIGAETYDGKTRYRANWLNPNADAPQSRGGGYTPADPTLLASLRGRFGTAAKAVAGGSTAGAPPAPTTDPAPAPIPSPPGGDAGAPDMTPPF